MRDRMRVPKLHRREDEMPVYMADRSLPGITMDQLAAAQKAAIDTSRNEAAKLPYTRIVEAKDLTP